MALGLRNNLSSKSLITPGIVTDNLVLKHKYDAGSVIPVSDGAAYFISSSNDYISFSEISLSPHDTPCSFTFWAWRTTIDSWDIALGHNSVSNYRFLLFDDAGGDRLLFEGNTDGDSATGTTAINANEWNHFAVCTTGSSGAVKMYQNGAEISVSGTMDDDILLDRIGGGAGNFFGGYICNVGIWNGTQLTQEQVKSIMNKNYAGLTDSEKTNLVSWWNLDETIETTNISDEPNIVLDNNASNTEVLNWESNFSGTGITENANSGNFEVNANPPYTES